MQCTENCIVSRYIENPLLINHLKFDLRVYVLVTSYKPLTIYIYNEGLVRFATDIYNKNADLKNAYAHLTNYAINKHNMHFKCNKNCMDDDQGNKWSISALFDHLAKAGINVDLLRSRIYDVIIKTLLAGHDIISDGIVNTGLTRQNFFELYGFDILIDNSLKYDY